jgi:hypothetical protein
MRQFSLLDGCPYHERQLRQKKIVRFIESCIKPVTEKFSIRLTNLKNMLKGGKLNILRFCFKLKELMQII